jgi:hypothetical protein
MKRIGPELKMPKLETPGFLSDLLFDLRQRGLLPILILVVVAIVAAPILLSKGSEEEAVVPPSVVGSASGASGGHRSLAVVQLKPGLRAYNKRLAHRSPTDPFKQRYTGPVLKGSELNPITTSEGPSSSGGGPEGEAPAESAPSFPSSPGTLPGGAPAPKPGELISYAWAVDVQITHTPQKSGGKEDSSRGTTPGSGKEAAPETTRRKRVLPYAGIPSEKLPVVVYMGPDPKTHKPILLVSDGVASTFGEGRCLAGNETCQLLEVEPGMPETFSYGPNLDRYKINVLKIYRTVTTRTQITRTMSQSFSK